MANTAWGRRRNGEKQGITLPEGGASLMLGQMESLLTSIVTQLATPIGSLLSLFAASFLAATVIPLSSEAVLFAVLKVHGNLYWPALIVATAGNTLGGMSSYLIGRYIGTKKPLTQLARLQRYGSPAMIFAWLPVVGDGLCIASGWLKLDWAAVAAWQTLGRILRYLVVAQGAMG